jgi:hypothetical protein
LLKIIHPASPLSKGAEKYEHIRGNRSMMRKDSSVERLPRSRSLTELASRPTGASDITTDFHRLPSRARSLEEPASRPIAHEIQSLHSEGEGIQRTEPESQRTGLAVVSDRVSSAPPIPGDIQSLLERLNIAPGGEGGKYAINVERAKKIKDNLRRMEKLREEIGEVSQALAADSELKWYQRQWSPPDYRISMQMSKWASNMQIEGLNSKIASIMNEALSKRYETFMHEYVYKGWTEWRKALIEGHKKAIRLNDWLAEGMVSRKAKVALALGIAAVGSIPSSVIADRVLASSVISNIIATGFETFLFDKVSFPLNVITNGVQWTGWNTGSYEVQLAIEKAQGGHSDETIGQGHNFTTDAFSRILTDQFGNLTVGDSTFDKLLAGRLDDLAKQGPITIHRP